MTNHIDTEVAAFRAQLDFESDVDRMTADVKALGREIMRAESHDLAAVALREFHDAHPNEPEYAHAVILATLAQFGLHVILAADLRSFDGDDGLLRRMKRLAYAARGLGLPELMGAL